MFEVTILVNDVRFQYGFTVNQTNVLEEWLFAWPKGRRQTWFEREENNFNFGFNLKGENRVIEQVTRRNSLFLSTAAQHQHPQLIPIYDWFRKIRTVRVQGYKERYSDAMPIAFAAAVFASAAAAAAAAPNEMVRLRDLIPDLSDPGTPISKLDDTTADSLRRLITAADVGITDFRVESGHDEGSSSSKEKQKNVLMRHESVNGDGWLPLEQESAGTRALFQLGPVVIETLESGGLLVVDELESSLHPFIAMRLVDLFNHPTTNPNNAQLVFTTHDTSLLATTVGDAILRRDQIWLTEKDKTGATTLYPLTDYKPRKEENLERGYLQGRYGGIPFLGNLKDAME
jgi:hypothetical protein